jgi:hypothetical protein
VPPKTPKSDLAITNSFNLTVLGLSIQGYSVDEIAIRLNITPDTVRRTLERDYSIQTLELQEKSELFLTTSLLRTERLHQRVWETLETMGQTDDNPFSVRDLTALVKAELDIIKTQSSLLQGSEKNPKRTATSINLVQNNTFNAASPLYAEALDSLSASAASLGSDLPSMIFPERLAEESESSPLTQEQLVRGPSFSNLEKRVDKLTATVDHVLADILPEPPADV